MEEKIQQFLEFTNENDTKLASEYLQMADGNLEQAIELWTQMHNPSGTSENENPETLREPDKIYSQSLYPENPWLGTTNNTLPNYKSPFDQGDTDSSGALSKMYAPPNDINTPGNFFEAQNMAVEKQLWLLVNIQDPKEFKCHLLNRDVWSSPTIREIIRGNFIFWQREISSDDGTDTFMSLYKVPEIPFVAIIHPRTGKLLKVFKHSIIECDTFITTQLFEFLDQYYDGVQGDINPKSDNHYHPSSVTSQAVSTSISNTDTKDSLSEVDNKVYHGVNSELAELRKQREARKKQQ